MGAGLRLTAGPMIARAGDLAGILTNLQPRDVLFVDEIHRLSPTVEEILYPAMEDFRLDVLIGEGPDGAHDEGGPAALHADRRDDAPGPALPAAARPLRHHAAPGLLRRRRAGADRGPLRAHPVDPRSRPRPPARSARAAAARPASPTACCAGCATSPRSPARTKSTSTRARQALARLEVDEHGFDELDRRILATIIEKFGGGPVGVGAIAASLGEDRGTLEDLYEPYLLQAGFLQRTPRGRVASPAAYRHLGIVAPRRDGELF